VLAGLAGSAGELESKFVGSAGFRGATKVTYKDAGVLQGCYKGVTRVL
jgi:hypothetical protein